ncbi:MAG: hypothetical protein KDA73_06380 [Rhodobacteraceae bacterium]|nr:hypothetical protein [Paracoccaceae bacterium]
MKQDRFQDLIGSIESASKLDIDLAAAALAGLRTALPEASSDLRPSVIDSTDAALDLVARTLPGWLITLDGNAGEPGHWSCTLRQSGVRDDDEVIGTGRAPTSALALVSALIRVSVARKMGYD